jgi:hypothetical protein
MASDAGGQRQGDLEMVLHPVRLADWYATQSGRGVAVFERPSEEPSAVQRPPDEWGDRWAWNLCDGGIYFNRNFSRLSTANFIFPATMVFTVRSYG